MHVSDDTRVGTEIAGYRIESLLGWGGMSVVYLAEDLRLKRRVALKLLAAGLAEDESFRDRFLRESELAASIDHPNIVPIYEAGATEDLLFIAMRYVEGRDLKERLRQGRLDATDTIGILAQIASALDAAHARGLVHRDVKPSNVLLDAGARPDGSDHVYLADFGLTRKVSESASSDDGHLLGTIDYVAPEQIAGEEVDGRADVYSLGCVLYECLVGEPPFRRDSELAVVFAHLETESPPPSARRPELPAALDAVIARALAKDPAERYPSCRDLAQAALAVAVDEASRRLVDVASRAAAGRSDLSEVEAELTGKVFDLQLAREQAHALSEPHTPARVASEGVCPFKGLASFEPVDAEYYVGRERLVAELVAHLVGVGFLGIVGPSGSGKSSVLRAGLLPALAGGVLPGSGSWRRLLLRPGERPLEELRRVLVSGAKDPLGEVLDTLPAGERLLLAVDQLEELFTACQSDIERASFADALARAASDPESRAVVVVALRADFYGRFAAYPALAELLGANNVLVSPMQASELRRVVELPAARVGLRVEPELADALVDDVEGEPGALPLLSTALLELWQKREAGGALTLASYRESGGVRGAVARLAEGTYARVPDERKPLVRALMLRLVGEGEGETSVRRRAPLAELDLNRNDAVAGVLATLADSRLVTVSEGNVEVAHEALLREWPRLREWIEEDTEGRRLRRHITQAAAEWDAAGRDQGELYRGARLAAALDWTADHTLDVNALEREFVTESREASEKETKRVRRTNRRLRGLLAGAAVLLVAAVAGGIFAAAQRSAARDAETGQVAQRLGAQALVEDDLDLSLLLARQAVAIDDSPQTRSYLLSGLLRSPATVGIMHGRGDRLREIAVSPDGKTVAVGGIGSAGLRFFDAETYEQIGEPVDVPVGPEGVKEVASLAFSPDGETLAFVTGFDATNPGFLRVIDVETREVLAEEANWFPDVTFTNDGSLLVLTEYLDFGVITITFRDARTLQEVGRRIQPGTFAGPNVDLVYSAPFFALTPDGRSVVTASADGELAWWDLESHEKRKTVEIATGYHAVAISPDGRTVAIGIDSGIQLVNTRTGYLRTNRGALAGAPQWLLFSPDGRTVVSTGLNGAVTLLEAETGTPRATFQGHSAAARQPAFSPDGATLYTSSDDGTVIAWDMDATRRIGRSFTFTSDGTYDPAFDRHPVSFSPDGRRFAVGLRRGGIRLWDAATLTPTGAPLLTGSEVTALAFSPDGRMLAAVTSRGMATVWDVGSRALTRDPFPTPRSTVGVSFSADGKTLVTASPTGVDLWNVATGAALGRVGRGNPADDVAFSPAGDLVAFARSKVEGGGDAEVWNAAKRSRVATLHIDAVPRTYRPGRAFAVAFSPDGHMLATAGDYPRVGLWDVESGALVRTFEQGVGGVSALEFSPDGTTLAISGFDPAASLWDVSTGTQIGPRLVAGSRATMLDLSPDGRRLLTTAANGQGVVWDVDPESWKRRACELANRTLTREEWDEFLPGRPYQPACTT